MVYKNLFLRLFVSLILILTYSIISFYDFSLVFYLIILIYLFVLIEIFVYFQKYKLVPTIYVLISIIFFLNINFSNKNYFNLFIFIVIIFDSFSYIIGKYLGKRKLINISPNKTIEGFIGGIFFSLILSIIFAHYLNILINIKLIILIIIIILSAFIGDIVESFFKRKNNLKDSSELVPGHGGIFDRFDGFLFAIIFYSIFY